MENITRKVLVILSLFLVLASFAELQAQEGTANQGEVSIIPVPVRLEEISETFTVTSKTRIVVQKNNAEALRIAHMLAKKFQIAAELNLAVSEVGENGLGKEVIFFTTENVAPSLGAEGYQLSVTNNAVTVKAVKPAGLFYGMQTINQLLPAEIESLSRVENIVWQIPGVEIEDQPRFKWRGMHLDVSRHFMPIAFIK